MQKVACGPARSRSAMSGQDLHNAAERGQLVRVKELLAQRAQLDYKDVSGDTALIEAAYQGHTTVAQVLLEARANINDKTKSGMTALHYARNKGHTATAQVLLEARANLNAKNNVLLEARADFNAKTNNGKTVLDWARESNREETAKLLEEAPKAAAKKKAEEDAKKKAAKKKAEEDAKKKAEEYAKKKAEEDAKKLDAVKKPLEIRIAWLEQEVAKKEADRKSLQEEVAKKEADRKLLQERNLSAVLATFAFSSRQTGDDGLARCVTARSAGLQLLELEKELRALDRSMLDLRVSSSSSFSSSSSSSSSSFSSSSSSSSSSSPPPPPPPPPSPPTSPAASPSPSSTPEARQRLQELVKAKQIARKEWASAAKRLVDQVSSLKFPLSTQSQGLDRKQAAPILERITRRCNYLRESATRLLRPSDQPEGKQRELKARGQLPGDSRPVAKAQIESALAHAATWANTLIEASSARNQAALELAATLEPIAQVLKRQGQPLSASDSCIELYHQALEKLNHTMRQEKVLRDSIETSYPEKQVMEAAVREEMVVRQLDAQAMGRLVERVKTDLAGWSQAEELPQAMASLHRTWQLDIIDMHDEITGTKRGVRKAKARLEIAEDEEEQRDLEQRLRKLEASLDRQQEALARRHREFRQAWENLATNAQHLRLELLLPIYWEVQTQKKPPAWVQFWAGQFDTGGLERTDISLDSYLNRELIPTNASSHNVYMASREGKRVALKVFTVAKKDRQKFLKEARLLQRLGSHPHVARIRAFAGRECVWLRSSVPSCLKILRDTTTSVNLTFWDPKVNQVYLEMPWYGRGNLAAWIEAKQQPSKEEIRIVFRQLLMGLQHIHSNGVVHCAIKPENVFLEEGPALQIKIGDFDVSQDKDQRATVAAEHGRTSLTVRGFTPMYMAPELLQRADSRCSEASDVYAAGLIFYDMLMGAAHRRAPPPSFPSLDTIEPAERALLQQWLHQNPKLRSTIPDLLRLIRSLWKPKWPCPSKCNVERLSCKADGLDCPANQPAHFACAACLSGHVQTESLKEMDQLRKVEGKVFCPLRRHGCEGKQPYEMALLASRVTPEAFQALIEAIRKLQEQKLSQDMEARFNKQLKEEMERYERLSAEQRQVQQARVHIVEELLTLKCPRPHCRRAFLDFDGCFALTCGGCGCGFCALCLQDCGHDAHAHVANCNVNTAPGRDVFSTRATFEQAQNARRERLVRGYLRTLESAELQGQVMDAVRPSLRQLGLHLG
eukprot:g25834.t1